MGGISLVLVVVQSLGKEQQWQQMICASGLSHIFLLCHDYDDDDDDDDSGGNNDDYHHDGSDDSVSG